jgi:type IX secretion system PorP/SprF family membrane protein
MRISAILLLFYIYAVNVFAQQDAMYTHYMFNTQSINPAYAGTREALTLTGLHRSMWVGFEGAPITQTFNLHSPIPGSNFGVGLSFYNDKIGPSHQNDIALDLSYKLALNDKFKLSFGVKPSMNFRSVRLSSLNLDENNDQAFSNDIRNAVNGNVGAGLYLYSDRFYAGISSPGMLETRLYKSNNISSIGDYKRHFYFIIGSVFRLSNSIEFKPTSFVKITPNAPIQVDLTGTFIFENKFWLGVMGRSNDAYGVLVGYNITEQLALGYSFDWSFANTTFQYNYGSHEIVLRYDFIYSKQKQIISPRYF